MWWTEQVLVNIKAPAAKVDGVLDIARQHAANEPQVADTSIPGEVAISFRADFGDGNRQEFTADLAEKVTRQIWAVQGNTSAETAAYADYVLHMYTASFGGFQGRMICDASGPWIR